MPGVRSCSRGRYGQKEPYLVVVGSAGLCRMPYRSAGQADANGRWQWLAVVGGPGSEVDPVWGASQLLFVSIIVDLLLWRASLLVILSASLSNCLSGEFTEGSKIVQYVHYSRLYVFWRWKCV